MQHDNRNGRDQAAELSEPERPATLSMDRREEHLVISAEVVDRTLRARKRVLAAPVQEEVTREIEDAEVERVEAEPNDSGRIETLPDGSLSIPVLEEEILITKRVVTRERLIIRKQQRTEQVTVSDEVRREIVDIETDDGTPSVSEKPAR